jgi:hypothetical protein
MRSNEEAEAALQPLSRFKFKTVYDRADFPRDALLFLNPAFEYPDWDYRTIGEFIKHCRLVRKRNHEHAMVVRISRHKERLNPAIDVQKHAWKLKAHEDKAALECVIHDIFAYAEEFGMDAQQIIDAGEEMYRRKSRERGKSTYEVPITRKT